MLWSRGWKAGGKGRPTPQPQPPRLDFFFLFAVVYLFIYFNKSQKKPLSDLIRAKQGGGTKPKHPCDFKRRWTQTVKWRSLVQENDGFISLITAVNRGGPDAVHAAGLQRAAAPCAWSHGARRDFLLPPSVSGLCLERCRQIYADAARRRLRHDARRLQGLFGELASFVLFNVRRRDQWTL